MRGMGSLLATRIIPALAGNTLGQGRPAPSRGDHPRSRGEYNGGRLGVPGRGGSSPLSRGILVVAGVTAAHLRIIPALAGNTAISAAAPPRVADHPRSRGEYARSRSGGHWPDGSSPLSRGIQPRTPCQSAAARIIPALAGNTRSCSRRGLVCSDHPRSRGEYRGGRRPGLCWWGSSPLSRGIPGDFSPPSLIRRIIPALAGNTHASCHPYSRR